MFLHENNKGTKSLEEHTNKTEHLQCPFWYKMVVFFF